LEARLGKRVRALRLATYTAYRELLEQHDPGGEERTRFINAITTNETTFFREEAHFAYLADTWLPAWAARQARGAQRLRIWSAACSTGEEPYSIAMTLLAHGVGEGRILASDIDTDVLARAAQAIYPTAAIAPVPRTYVPRFFLRGIGAQRDNVRVRPEVRTLVTFRRIGLLDAVWPLRVSFDVVFCRNVLMYFDRPTQARVLSRLRERLTPDGVLILGHAESVIGLDTALERVSGTIYRRTE
jgi:chemotaxis protein methyltransferase CheR